MSISAKDLGYEELNVKIREAGGECVVDDCLGHRFIGAGMSGVNITLNGIPGNAMGAYLNGAVMTVNGNAQDAVGDTMNDGKIVIHGSIGDTAGYAMRGGEIYVKGNAGYRAGIHMKEYKDKKPIMVIGGRTGSFLGEYQAGGIIIVLGIYEGSEPIVGNFPSTGMHGGKLFIRGNAEGVAFPGQVTKTDAKKEDIDLIAPYIKEYCRLFGEDEKALLEDDYTMVTPDSKNPYKQMYVPN